ncbi:MAG: hypothetical protein KAY24_18795 [Candidatus Eisenbacteria sp.]|nr:hypothetical protein [Candidatus Eisenbacteria bacterium]
MPRPRKYNEVLQILRKHDPRFKEHVRKGKGSHRAIYHPDINGKAELSVMKCHGEGTELGRATLKAIIRRFRLPVDFFDRDKKRKVRADRHAKPGRNRNAG